MTVLQDIWILSHSGVVLFSRVFESRLEEQLFGALMSALNTFAEHLANGGLSSFELSEKRYIIKKISCYIFVASSSKQIKEKKLKEELEIVVEKFLKDYPPDWFINWDYDSSVFDCFIEEIEETLENPIKQFW
ncbi:MAG: hypothetical protein EU532_09125 [Promethearchaeota archaeon]|nr:MAG: hypothetical protein EU532_09125 [Candidatus Lokiarchaeota archaeon]